jgi:hypothetical protein
MGLARFCATGQAIPGLSGHAGGAYEDAQSRPFMQRALRTHDTERASGFAAMPSNEISAERYRRLKVGNLESSKRDHFRPDLVPFDRQLTHKLSAVLRLLRGSGFSFAP